jgi:Rad3-related DNA helicase
VNKLWTVSEFMTITKFFNLNFVKLLKFCEETQLEKKVNNLYFKWNSEILLFKFFFKKLIGFNEKFTNDQNSEANNGKDNLPKSKILQSKQHENENNTKETAVLILKSPLMVIKQFIKQLSSPFYDGRIILNVDQNSSSTLKYILLNPNICFEEILSQAKSVILAGGTMKPVKFIYNNIKTHKKGY